MEHSLWVSHCARRFMCIISCNPYKKVLLDKNHDWHFTDVKVESKRFSNLPTIPLVASAEQSEPKCSNSWGLPVLLSFILLTQWCNTIVSWLLQWYDLALFPWSQVCRGCMNIELTYTDYVPEPWMQKRMWNILLGFPNLKDGHPQLGLRRTFNLPGIVWDKRRQLLHMYGIQKNTGPGS